MAAALFLLAFLHRALFLLSNVDRSWGFTVFYEGDSEVFYDFARAILAGAPFDGGIPFHPPLWPHVLAGIHTFVGAGSPEARVPHLAVKLVVSALGAGTAPLLFLLAGRYLGRGTALLSALLATYSFGLYVISVAPVTESLYLLLLLGSLLALAATDHPLAPRRVTPARPPILPHLLLGLLLGLLALTRAEGVLLAAVLLVAGIVPALNRRKAREVRSRADRHTWLPWVFAAGALALTITPWTIRNHTSLSAVNARHATQMAEPFPTFVPITVYGPINFALANNEEADGTFSRETLPRGASAASIEITNPEHLGYLLHGYERGLDWIRSHPGDFLRLVLRKWMLFFDAGRLGFTQWNVPGGLEGVRRPVDLFVPDSPAAAWLLFPLALLGCGVLVRAGGDARRWALLIALVTGAGLIGTGLFFGYARLGVLALPFWLSAGAAGTVSLGVNVASRAGRNRASARRDGSAPRAGASGIAPAGEIPATRWTAWTPRPTSGREHLLWLGPLLLLLLVEVWGATGDRNFRATGTQAEGAAHLNPHDTMRLEVIRD